MNEKENEEETQWFGTSRDDPEVGQLVAVNGGHINSIDYLSVEARSA